MRKYLLYIIVLVGIFVVIYFVVRRRAGMEEITWIRTFGSSAHEMGSWVEQTKDGGYIVVGTRTRNKFKYSEKRDIWLIKTDAFGDTVWSRTILKSSQKVEYDDPRMCCTTDDGYLVTVLVTVYPEFIGQLVKIDADGNKLWSKDFGHGKWFVCPIQTQDGGYVITGGTGGDWLSLRLDIYLLKTDSEGNKVWEKSFGSVYQDEIGMDIQQTKDGGYIIVGVSEEEEAAILLIKTDKKGNRLWERIFEKSELDEGYSVRQTTDGGYIITGSTECHGKGRDVWLIKTDANGNKMWDKTFGGNKGDEGWCVRQTADDGYLIVGRTFSYGAGESDIWLIKTDANGNKVWDKTFGGPKDDEGYSVQQTRDGGYIIVGYTESFGAGGNDIWVIKTDADGSIKDTTAILQGKTTKEKEVGPKKTRKGKRERGRRRRGR
jgi:hypothetical protein